MNLTDTLFITIPFFIEKSLFIQRVNFQKVNQIIPLIMKKKRSDFQNYFFNLELVSDLLVLQRFLKLAHRQHPIV